MQRGGRRGTSGRKDLGELTAISVRLELGRTYGHKNVRQHTLLNLLPITALQRGTVPSSVVHVRRPRLSRPFDSPVLSDHLLLSSESFPCSSRLMRAVAERQVLGNLAAAALPCTRLLCCERHCQRRRSVLLAAHAVRAVTGELFLTEPTRAPVVDLSRLVLDAVRCLLRKRDVGR